MATLFLALLLVPARGEAKPSLRRVMKDMGYKDLISCKFKSGGKLTQKRLRVWYTRQVECKRKGGIPGKPRIKKMTDGYVEYLLAGRRYVFSSWVHWTTWYIGLPPPSATVVLNLVRANKLSFLGRSFDHGNIVSDLSNLKMAAKPNWTWSSPNRVTVSVVGNYRWKKGGYTVENVQHLKWVTLIRDTLKSPWRYQGTSKTRRSADRKVLSEKKYSPEEYNAMKSIKEKAEASSARAHLSSLPAVTIPIFRSGEELVKYTYRMLRTATPKQMEAYLRQVYSPWYFVKGSTVVMHSEGEKTMNKNITWALKGASKFKDQYCAVPVLRERGSYWNKDKSSWTRIVAVPGPGKWVNGKKVPGTYKLSDLQVSIVRGDKLARMNSYTRDMCPRPLSAAAKALRVRKASGSGYWKIGDKVSCAYKGRRRYYSGKVTQISGSKLFIKYSDGDTEWTTAKFCR
ncbi:hypothetical protein KKF84_14490 [Myxococcota bacterium]|nr:hypothetical protein [Myxococcota bacterium]